MKNEGSTNRKSIHAVQKGESGGRNAKYSSKNRPKSDPERERARKKWASQGKKREQFLEKVPEVGLKTRKDEKKVDFTGQKNECDLSKKCRKTDLKRGKVGKTEILE